MTDKIFMKCVHLLEKAAKKLGISYQAINVWVFCVIWPIITLGMAIALIVKSIQ